jgi:hypothetical protein
VTSEPTMRVVDASQLPSDAWVWVYTLVCAGWFFALWWVAGRGPCCRTVQSRSRLTP